MYLGRIGFWFRLWEDLGRLPDFSWYNIPKLGKMYQITIKYPKWPQNIPNDLKIDQMAIKYANIFPLQGPPKFTQTCIFGLKSGSPGS
jgi:hypothetical protein